MYPLGDKTVLICDLSGQYVDFYSTYYEILTHGKSLLYSWQAGMGLNFLGLFSYYLSSPFSLFIVFFEKQHLPEALLLIILLKVGAAGLTFLIYANYTFTEKHASQGTKSSFLIFSVLYALMAYSVVYSFNLMWLDGVIFLPLVLLGTEKILRENKYLLFIFSLISIFLANYYISYMVGLFAFLYFLAAFFSEHSFREIRRFAPKLFMFGFSALLAAGCAAILLVPTFYALRNGQGGPDLSLFNWKINFKLVDLLSKTPLGAYDTLQYKGLPNIYCGLLPFVLLPLYFINKKIPSKEKILYSSLLGFLVLSFNFSNLDIFWHAFDRPDWFPNRYSFVFSFLIIFLAVKSINTLEPSDLPNIAKVSTIGIILLILVQKMNYAYLSDKLLIISMILLGVYSLLLTGWLKTAKPRKEILFLVLSVLILSETSLNTWYLIRQMDAEFKYVTKQDYERTLSKLEPFIPELLPKDNNFYRLDRIGGRTYNDPMNLYYTGLTHFSSMSNFEVNKTLRQLGFLTTAGGKSVNFAGSTPITESLLGFKYVLSPVAKGVGYTEMKSKGEWKAYENNHVLPIGFLANEALLGFDPAKDNNPFTLQNKLVNLALGNTEETVFQNFFLPLPLKHTKLTNAFLTKENGKEVIGRINTGQDAAVEYTLINPRAGQVYVCFQTISNDVKIFLNEEEIKGYLPVYNKRIVDLGFHPQNKELKVKLSFRNQGFTLAEKYFYGLSENNLAKALTPLAENVLENVQVTDTSVRGTINVRGKTNNLLFTSILYDPGWQVSIDGRPASVRKIGNAFLGLELTEGLHEIFFSFTPEGLQIGKVISGISLLGLLSLILLTLKRRRRENRGSI